MKKLFASCAVVALMAAPALAQSTTDPTSPDTVPVTPQVEQPADDMDVLEPQTDILPEELPAEPEMAEDMAPPSPFVEPEVSAEADVEAETEVETGMAADTGTETEIETDMAAETEPTVTAEVAPVETELEASVEEADLPEEYSTDDLNARMLAQVNTVSSEISRLDAEADVWVSANGAVAADPAYVPEGQGDIDVPAEEDTYLTPEAEMPESESYMEPEDNSMMDDEAAEEADETEY